NFRFVRSPEAPKITKTHESPVGSGSCDNFSRGLAWIMADINLLSSMLWISISNPNRKLPTPASPAVHRWPSLPVLFAYKRQLHFFPRSDSFVYWESLSEHGPLAYRL